MTVTVDRPPAGSRSASILTQIADRRRADVSAALGERSMRDLVREADAAPAPRDLCGRLALPGLHLIAEIKRRSPSAGSLASSSVDVAARARAYQAGGASAISVLVEPHWFGGSVGGPGDRPRRHHAADPGQGVRGRRPAAAAAAGRRRGRGAAAGRAAPGAHARPAGARGPRPGPGAARGGPRQARAGVGAGHRRAPHRHQQPRPAHAHGRPRDVGTAAAAHPRRPPRRWPNRASATRSCCAAGAPSASMPRSSARS